MGKCADLGMHRGVDFGAPRLGCGVGGPQINSSAVDGGLGEQWYGQIALGVTAHVLHNALGLRILGVTEVRREAVISELTGCWP